MTDFTVTAPVAGFNGESCGVAFKNGTGRVTDGTNEGRAALDYFRRRGYTVSADTEDEPSQDPEAQQGDDTPPPPPADGPYDPSKHNADEVIAHLDALDTEDPDAKAEFDRIIAAERAGKNRKTITDKEAGA
ncbi:hypothetical protein [Streptomyces sp. NPDC088733]|uniref:hypothetical protein n=1 Tax=Streptomyces sp. NPDC088733 TaxID=3365880 RepID=UPI00381A8F8C